MPPIIPVIITYNRSSYLNKLLKSLTTGQLCISTIILINNNSQDNTESELIKNGYIHLPQIRQSEDFRHTTNSVGDIRIDYYGLTQNIGGAGGFHFGIQKAYEVGSEWIWVMDDDCIPEPDALELLLLSPAAKRNDTGFLASVVRWTDGSLHKMNMHGAPLDFSFLESKEDSGCVPVNQCSFVGMLIHRRAVEAVGLPIKDFFIWGDDTEYSRRITEKCGFKGYFIADSNVIHHTKENVGVSLDQLDDSTAWKFAYGWRNQIYIIRHYTSGRKLTVFIKTLLQARRYFQDLKSVNRLTQRSKRLLKKAVIKGLFYNPSI